MRIFGLFLVLLAVASTGSAEDSKTLPLMPWPASVRQGVGEFAIDRSFAVVSQGCSDPRIKRAAARLLGQVARQSEFQPSNQANGSGATLLMSCAATGPNDVTLGEDESYHLDVTATGARLDAPTPLGLLRGLQTFLQLVHKTSAGGAVPVLTVDDRPRFPWRGLLIDVARHFMPMDILKRNLDGMEAMKLNVLHWHLADDQGFRVESKVYPKFQAKASDGLFYTQADVQELIEYARDRGIRIVPEFDMPGHATAWFAAYPELASGPGPYQIERKWGIFNAAMDPTRDSLYEFLDPLIGEMAGLFPDPYFHIGGDEVNGKEWAANHEIQEFMRTHGLKDRHDLQAHFNNRVQVLVIKHGKIMVGWDEILHPDLPKDIVVQSWRGQEAIADAARKGYRGLLSYGYYLDLMQPASYHYSIDPLDPDVVARLTPEDKQRILGGEACMWSEYVSPENIDGRIWPRAAAIAERLWSPEDVRDVDSMYRRLEQASQFLESRGLTHRTAHRAMMERLSGGKNTPALEILGDVLEPVKLYERGDSRPYESSTPLNRLVDAVRPESETARVFALMVSRFIRNPKDSGPAGQLVTWLKRWHENDAQLQPVMQNSPLLQEAIPLSKDLEKIAAAGLEAVGYLKSGKRVPREWRDQQLAFLNQAKKPQAELLNMVVPSVLLLVQATLPTDPPKPK